jgi:hypothetical protein
MADQKGDLILLSREQIGPASEVLTRAFFNDSKLTHVLPDETIRTERGKHLFAFELRYGLNYGRVYATSAALEGVAVWLPSERLGDHILESYAIRRDGAPEGSGKRGHETAARLL